MPTTNNHQNISFILQLTKKLRKCLDPIPPKYVYVIKVNIINQKSKLMMKQGKKSFKSGYKKLYDSGLFGDDIQDRVDELKLIDKNIAHLRLKTVQEELFKIQIIKNKQMEKNQIKNEVDRKLILYNKKKFNKFYFLT